MIIDMKEYYREYYIKNRRNLLEQTKKYNRENRKKILEQNKEYSKQYRENNHEKIDKRMNRYQKYRRRIDLKFNLNCKMAVAISSSLKGKKAGRRWEDLVGYTLNDLIKRLKKTLPKNYTWKNYLNGDLHIDHIVPISAFNFNKSENPDFKRCWALNNLQLLPVEENLRKSNKLSKPFQPALKISFIP